MKTRIPHTYVLLFSLMVIAAVGTWFIPAGSYNRVIQNGRELIDPNSFRSVEARPAGLPSVLMAFPKALAEVADIVFYIFIIGGAFGVLNRTGAIQAGIHSLVRRLGGKRNLLLVILTLVFAIGGGTSPRSRRCSRAHSRPVCWGDVPGRRDRILGAQNPRRHLKVESRPSVMVGNQTSSCVQAHNIKMGT